MQVNTIATIRASLTDIVPCAPSAAMAASPRYE
jgi:hypothetical protein